jgi:hypothetical protein
MNSRLRSMCVDELLIPESFHPLGGLVVRFLTV